MTFDPYRKWLGILPKDYPPNHYRLLNVELFESDLDVIEGAADKQMGFVRQYQSGENAADAAKILNELAVARLCLLKSATKSAYDLKLRQQLADAATEFPEISDVELQGERISRKRKKKASNALIDQGLLLKGGIAVVVMIVGVILFNGRNKPAIENPAKPLELAEASPAPPTKLAVELSKPTSPVISKLPTNPIRDDVAQKTMDPSPGAAAIESAQSQKTPVVLELTPTQSGDAAPAPTETPASPPTPAPLTKPDSEPAAIVGTRPSGLVQDKTEIELDAAIAAYVKEKDAFCASVLSVLEKREDTARKAGDKKSIDQTSAEREAFETWNVIPRNLPAATIKSRADARTVMENTFIATIKSYVKAKKDDAALITEKKLWLFRGEDWRHLDLEAVKFKGDSFQISKNSTVSTNEEFSGPVEIHVTARTEKNNIRLYANTGAKWVSSIGRSKIL